MLKKVFLLFLFLCFNLNAQIVINKPSLGFTQACASSTFNNFTLSFTFFPTAQAGNNFIIELSDATGSFAAPTVLKTFAQTTSPVNNTAFSFPSTVFGAGYLIRVRSTNPASTSPASNVFSAYYAVFNQSFTINNNQPSARMCNGQALNLSIDSGPSSPLQYPQLKYRWLKDNAVLSGQSGTSLNVSQAGNYYAEVDYGTCTYSAYSNAVTVSNVALTPQIQTADFSNIICEGTPKQIICSVQNLSFTYKWYKDGQLISGATGFTYDATLPGIYKVTVSDGSCAFDSNTLTIQSNPISAVINQPVSDLIIPGQQLILSTLTDASQPTYTWYRNNVLISGETGSTLTITSNGTYKVIVKQNQGCLAEKSSEVTIKYPTGFDVGIQNSSAYSQCQSTSANLVINKFLALTSSTPINILGNNFGYGYQWYKNGIAISGAISTTLNLSDALENGIYKLGVTIPDFGEVFSNTIDVQLKITADVTISNNTPLCKNGDAVILQSQLTNSNYTYDWYLNGTKVATNNSGSHTVTQKGSYYLIAKIGSCSIQSNTLNLQESNFNLSISSPALVIVPNQQLTLNVSTDAVQPTYTWFKDGVLLTGQTSSILQISKNGLYKVTVLQNQGCVIEKSTEISIQYPTGFDIGIQNSLTYTQCQNTSANLVVNKFLALTSSTPINILGNNLDYGYQWYKNGIAVSGATSTTLNLSDALENGIYKLGVTIPDFGEVFSNTIDVQLKITADVSISNNTPLCKNGDPVILQSQLTNSNYTYDWYFNGTKVATNNSGSHTVTQKGSYYLIAKIGSCFIQSNTLNLQESNFNLSISSPALVIVPNQQLTLNVSTDAVQPTYTWFKDGAVLTGQTSSILQISKSGLYKVTVQQNQGCVIEKSTEITIQYPSGFDIGIQNSLPYTQCQNTLANLVVNKFLALTSSTPINILGNNYNYSYQWYKNGSIITGATSTTLNLSEALKNGTYKLGVTIPDFGEIFSNSIDVQLKITSDITITTNGSFCKNGDSVVFQSELTDSNYTYDWYLNGVKVASDNTGSYTATQAGTYYLIVRIGACSSQSNTINVQEANFNLNVSSPSTTIVPGQQFSLSATTDAMQPTFKWFKDGILLAGQSTNTLQISKNGTYKVSVQQNQGCSIEKSSEITVQYPTGFDIGIQNSLAYTQCQSTSANLVINKFLALTSSTPINILGNNFNYGYQWYKNGIIVPGATSDNLNLSDALANGIYKLGVTIPDFGEIFSSSVDVQLKITSDITLTSTGTFCKNGDSVVFESQLTDPNYTYEWYSNGTKLAANNSGNYTATQAGSYYLVVKSGTCSLQSNTITLQESQFNLSISSPSMLIIPGQQLTLTATTDAAQPTYTWFKDGVLLQGQTTNSLQINTNGIYKVAVKQNQGCSVEKSSEINIQYPTGFEVGIQNSLAYTQCQSTSANLVINKFLALTSSGSINILGNNYNYSYQWYKNDTPIPGATSNTLNLTDALNNGNYKLGVRIPDFGEIFSNSIDVQLKITKDITIINNSLFCKNGDSVVLQSNLTDPNYTYDWYSNGVKIATNNSGTYTVSQSGSYYMIARSGTCSLQSNTIILTEGVFSVFITPESPFIIPGQVMTLTTTTDALQPTFAWYKDGQLLNGENLASLKISAPGIYKVVVDQTQGCQIEKSAEMSIGYPSGFTASIAADSTYQECKSTSTTLKFIKLTANSFFGNVDLTSNPYNYNFQWYKNDVLIPGATGSNLSIPDFSQNASYKLQVIIPDFPQVFSNSIKVLLGFSTPLTITQTGIFCDNGSEVTLSANYTDMAFTYQWFESSSSNVIGTQNTIVINKTGNYYLKASQNGCSLSSNIISVEPFDFSQVSVDAPEKFSIPEGGQRVITATGADSYQWYFNNQLVSKDNSYTVTLEGTYNLLVKVGECEKTYVFEVTYLVDTFVVTNTVTPNGDGFNDYWSIPLEYAYKDEMLVSIYDASGNIVLRTVNYQNNWPEGNFQFSQKSPVYYYLIEKVAGGMLKQGSITIIK